MLMTVLIGGGIGRIRNKGPIGGTVGTISTLDATIPGSQTKGNPRGQTVQQSVIQGLNGLKLNFPIF